MDDYVQYIVVRKDLVPQMGVGKTAAQVAHASLGVLLEENLGPAEYYPNRIEDGYGFITCWENGGFDLGPAKGIKVFHKSEVKQIGVIKDEGVQEWLKGIFTKLVVYVKSKEKLLNIAEKLDKDGIRIKLIYDSCLTNLEAEEENGTTLTCMGIIPLKRDLVPKYLKKLQLLE